MYFWNIGVSNVSMVNLLLSIGMAVDAVAHVTHSFNHALYSTGDSREAVLIGLGTVGSSVFSGTFTSFLGILPLAFATHEILRIFWKFFFSIFLLGRLVPYQNSSDVALLHGLMLVPIILSFIKKGNNCLPDNLRSYSFVERMTEL